MLEKAHFNRSLFPEQEAEVCRRYTAGENTALIAPDFGVHKDTILNVLKRCGVPRRSASEALRRYSCDDGFFDRIDAEVKAYWLGFLAADGCVTDQGDVVVQLSSRNRNHLLRFKSDLQATNPIRDYTKRAGTSYGKEGDPVSVLSIRSSRLVKGLIAHGVVPRKTFILQWPDSLSPDLVCHYLRGYSDGDGCFYLSGGVLYWSIVGTEAFCLGAQHYLMDALGLGKTKLRASPNARNQGIFQLRYKGTLQLSRLWRLLYDGATVYLPRKYGVGHPYLRSVSLLNADVVAVDVARFATLMDDQLVSSWHLAKAAGLSPQTLVNVLRTGRARPSTVRKLAIALGVEPSELVKAS